MSQVLLIGYVNVEKQNKRKHINETTNQQRANMSLSWY